MTQVINMEISRVAFEESAQRVLAQGFRIITGSVMIKSVYTDINMDTGEYLNDTDIELYVSLINNQGEILVASDDIPKFTVKVNHLLTNGFRVVTGSMYIANVKNNGYDENVKRNIITIHSCFMHRD